MLHIVPYLLLTLGFFACLLAALGVSLPSGRGRLSRIAVASPFTPHRVAAGAPRRLRAREAG